MTATEIVASFDNDTLNAVHFSNIGRSLRDSDGNLREMTAEEGAWIAATRDEMRRRGLV